MKGLFFPFLAAALLAGGQPVLGEDLPIDDDVPMTADPAQVAPPAEDDLLGSEEKPPAAAAEEAPPAEQPEAAATKEAPPPATAEQETQESLEPEKPQRSKWTSPYHQKRWPGAFLGMRASFAGGAISVPRFGITDTLKSQSSVTQLAPYLGIEAGKVPLRWGGSVSVEATMFGAKPEYLYSAPLHVTVSLNVIRAPRDSKFRWVVGFHPYTAYYLAYPTGQSLLLRGFGLRAGAHYLLQKSESSFVEGFAFATFDRLTEASGGFDGNTKSYPVSDFTGNGKLNSVFLVMAGIQLNLSW